MGNCFNQKYSFYLQVWNSWDVVKNIKQAQTAMICNSPKTIFIHNQTEMLKLWQKKI